MIVQGRRRIWPHKFVLNWCITWLGFEICNKNQPQSIVLPWIRKYRRTDFLLLICLATVLSQAQHQLTLNSLRWFVYSDRLIIFTWRPGPKSLERVQAWETDFEYGSPLTLQDRLLLCSGWVTPWIADILADPHPFLERIRVSGPCRHPWSTANSKISPPHGPKRPNLNVGLLFCCRGDDVWIS